MANARSLLTLTRVEPTTVTFALAVCAEAACAARFLAEAALGCEPALAACVGFGSFLGSPSSLATWALETFLAFGTA